MILFQIGQRSRYSVANVNNNNRWTNNSVLQINLQGFRKRFPKGQMFFLSVCRIQPGWTKIHHCLKLLLCLFWQCGKVTYIFTTNRLNSRSWVHYYRVTALSKQHSTKMPTSLSPVGSFSIFLPKASHILLPINDVLRTKYLQTMRPFILLGATLTSSLFHTSQASIWVILIGEEEKESRRSRQF